MKATGRKTTALLGAAMVAAGAWAAPTITVTGAQQRYPWNNIVDVTYTLANAGEDPDTYAVVLTTTIDGAEVELSNGCEPSTNGTHTAICVLPSDLQATDLKVTGKIYEMAECVPTKGNLDANNDYIIVDLDKGGETYEARLDYQALSNRRYKTLEYMTSKMVFRKLPAGDYKYFYGEYGASGAAGTPTTDITITNYWVAIYPCTEAQYARLSRAATTNDSVTVKTDIARNAVAGTPYETMAALTGTSGKYTMPGYAQWEVAARAGSTTDYHWGDNWDDTVGTLEQRGAAARFVPNVWGFYDMNGTVIEWTDTYSCNSFYGGCYVLRSGANHDDPPLSPNSARSSYVTRYYGNDGNLWRHGVSGWFGFRLARVEK